jgi:hypothetical protein
MAENVIFIWRRHVQFEVLYIKVAGISIERTISCVSQFQSFNDFGGHLSNRAATESMIG